VKSETKTWLKRLAILAILAAAIYLFDPVLSAALGAGVGLATAAVYLAAYIFSIVVLPLVVFALARFVYSVWGKTYFRAWHINHIRHTRLLREAGARRDNVE
jgi:hypothetical protein